MTKVCEPSPEQLEPPWLTLAKAEIGVKEIPGARSNARIIEYFSTTRLGGPAGGDSTPWCSAFCNWVMQQAGYIPTRRANARSWLTWGEEIDEPRLGAIAVLWRDNPVSPAGHVGFYVASLPNRVVLLSGNQNNAVGYKEYGTGRVLSYRWPKGVP